MTFPLLAREEEAGWAEPSTWEGEAGWPEPVLA
jgi:hypothetical protein